MWTAGPRLDYNRDPGGTLPAAFNTELFKQESVALADLEYYTRWDRTNTFRAGQVFETGLQTTSLNGIADAVLAFLANVRSDAQVQLDAITAAAQALASRVTTTETGLTGLVTRLLRWSFDGPTDTVSITSAQVSLQATTVTSLNTITAQQLSHLTGLTASVEARLVANAASITALVNRLLRWSYTAATDAVAITSATVSLPATTAASVAAASVAATEAAVQNVTGTRVSARTLWAEQEQCARLQVSAPPWPVAYLFNGQGMWPLLQSRTTAGLGLDVAMPVRVSVSPGWMLRFERTNGGLVAMVDARGQTDWVHQVSLTFTIIPPRIILGR